MGNAYPFIVGLKWLVAVRERERERESQGSKVKVLDRVEANLGRGSCTLKTRQEVLKERAK